MKKKPERYEKPNSENLEVVGQGQISETCTTGSVASGSCTPTGAVAAGGCAPTGNTPSV
jgi:hypothetical protein